MKTFHDILAFFQNVGISFSSFVLRYSSFAIPGVMGKQRVCHSVQNSFHNLLGIKQHGLFHREEPFFCRTSNAKNLNRSFSRRTRQKSTTSHRPWSAAAPPQPPSRGHRASQTAAVSFFPGSYLIPKTFFLSGQTKQPPWQISADSRYILKFSLECRLSCFLSGYG